MKKLILITLLPLVASSVYCQELNEDTLIRVVNMTDISLNSGVTMDEFIAFYQNEVIPVYEESLPEVQFYLIKAIRGKDEGNLGVLWIAESNKVWEKYHNPDFSYTKAGLEARQNLQPVLDQLNELGTLEMEDTYWVIQ